MVIKKLKSFQVRQGNKILNYRSGEKLDLSRIKSFFQDSYNVKKLWNASRHVLGILTKNDVDYFLKLSTSEGISVVTKNEYSWNDYFNKYFPKELPYQVPKNFKSGLYQQKFFYLITDYFDGEILCDINEDATQLPIYIEDIILLSELIQKMPKIKFSTCQYEDKAADFKQKFTDKANKWFNDIPTGVRKKFKTDILLKIVEKGVDELISRPRHGDFTPWHMIRLQNSRLGLIDGEHSRSDSVEGYDICYLIQRVFSVLKNPSIAQNIYFRLLTKGYEKNKLKTVLAARAIGGFLDESLAEKSEYNFANQFKDWIIQLD
ncbi:hypothetical protein KKE78_02380 [Patescibacteria group bacterium]|nr:hypothetical protein [Patescibacteria group bacterium]